MTALLAMIPAKDWIYGTLIASLLAFGFYEVHHLKAEGAAQEAAALQKSSAELQVKADAQVQVNAANYAATVAAITERENANTQTANAQLSDAAKRVSDYDAYRRSHPNVGSPATAAAIAGSGSVGTSGIEDEFRQLEQVALSLASSTAHDVIALTQCMQERDALTGKN
jgi:hypothetical protein